MNLPRVLFILAVSCVTLPHSQTAQAQFQSLVSRVPSEANVMIFIDVEKLHSSPLAKMEGWAGRHEQMFSAGLLAVPPKSSKLVNGIKFDLDSMKSVWDLSVMNLDFEPSMADVATRFRGTVDNIQNRDVAVLPGDIYVVKLNKQTVASGYPAHRQDVGRWLNRIYSNTPITHSKYLLEAQKFAENGAPLIIALDLSHAISPGLIKDRLSKSKALEGQKIDLDAAAKALASIRGVTLGVAVTDRRGGSLKVDFTEDISALKDVAKPLVLEVLERNGASIREFYDWEVEVTANQILLRGELFQSGTRRILSLLESPPALQSYQPNDDGGQTDKEKMALASKLYFRSIESLIDDVRDKKSERQTMGQLSVWFDRYSRKIDRLSVLNVDKDLVAYGGFVSDTFRGGASSVTSAAATSRIQQSQVPEQYDTYTYSTPIGVTGGNYGGGPSVWGWGGWQAVPNDARRGRIQSQIRTEQNIRGSLSANTALEQVDAATRDIRQLMTDRYSADF